MFELLSLVPCCPPIKMYFLNRRKVLDLSHQAGQSAEGYLSFVRSRLDEAFQDVPKGYDEEMGYRHPHSTPAKERIEESFARNLNKSTVRYFFGDGDPDGGRAGIKAIMEMLIHRPNPRLHPFTFLSCTNIDSDTEWMKLCAEAARYCTELDDYNKEATEILNNQGKAFPYTYGMHLLRHLVAAIDDNDGIDECVPLTKSTLDNLMATSPSPWNTNTTSTVSCKLRKLGKNS